MIRLNLKSLGMLLLCSVSMLLGACSDNDNNNMVATPPPPPPPPATASFEVTVSNLTNSQPFSPVAVIAHQSGYSVFEIGTAASVGLEELAEGGDNSALLAEADADSMVISSNSGAAPIGPAGSETVTVDLLESDLPGLLVSVATMLVNTNDAFTSPSVAVEDMMVGDILTFYSVAYDAGTEADTEIAAFIPGPAGGGTGFDAMRDDGADRVSMHSGVVSQDDGLASSDLSEQHRFDNPVAHFRIERTD
jgi:hypothetical protein